jgi:hypothetical protein
LPVELVQKPSNSIQAKLMTGLVTICTGFVLMSRVETWLRMIMT